MPEIHPPLSAFLARSEASRCLYCHDPPCLAACPTAINIPEFIHRIADSNPLGAAEVILSANPLGASCARVCPVEELCEGACVLGAQYRPIAIGQLQRYATDSAYATGRPLFQPGPASGKRVAVVGAGPAGLACATGLLQAGHAVTIYEQNPLAGGLSSYGIIPQREPLEVALAEVAQVVALGAELKTGVKVDSQLCQDLIQSYDAVFLALGLGQVNDLELPGAELAQDGLEWIASAKLAPNNLRVLNPVVVIGGGNTALDCATVARAYGAEVTVLVRRSAAELRAYPHEVAQAHALGIQFRFLAVPARITAEGVWLQDGTLVPAAQVIRATGQSGSDLAGQLGLAQKGKYISVDAEGKTNLERVWAGGDCTRSRGMAATVTAVRDGLNSAASIDHYLQGERAWRT
jgi:glutamate synthase (NADPH/NADH) small chain